MKLQTVQGLVELESNQYDIDLAQKLGIKDSILVHQISHNTYSEYAIYHISGAILPFRAIFNDGSFWFHIEQTYNVFLLLI